jgi:hypothetical protein
MRGYKVLALGLAAVVAFTFAACDEQPTEPEQQAQFKPDKLGNDYPMASFEYKLNILGVPQDKSADMDNNNGRRIFVMLEGGEEVTNPGGKNNHLKTPDINKIFLCNSTDGLNDSTDPRCEAWRADNGGEFGVIDANATDDDGALFGLPTPCDDHDSMTSCTPAYRIFARAKAGSGGAFITTCAEEEYTYPTADDNDIWCGDNGTLELTKQTHHKAKEITDSLLRMGLTIPGTEDDLQNCIQGTQDVDYSTTHYDIYLFDRCFENYFWNYDNNGLKNLELRFYWASDL